MQHDPSDERGERRLERDEDGKDLGPEASHSNELERGRDERRHDARAHRDEHEVRVRGDNEHAPEPERQRGQAADGERDGEPALARDERASALVGQDVECPERAGHERERDADAVEGLAGVGVHAEQHHAGEREEDGDAVAHGARQHRREQERAEELDGHGGAERDARDARVEEAVHRAERDAEHERAAPLLRRPAPHRGPGDGEEDDAGDEHAQRTRRPRPGVREQLRGQRGAELEEQTGAEDSQYGDPVGGRGAQCHGDHCAGAGERCTSCGAGNRIGYYLAV